jgi:hypothetical protein
MRERERGRERDAVLIAQVQEALQLSTVTSSLPVKIILVQSRISSSSMYNLGLGDIEKLKISTFLFQSSVKENTCVSKFSNRASFKM